MNRFAVLAVLSAAAVGFGAFAASATQTADVIGMWEWISVENATPDGRTTQPFGSKPGGYLAFDRSGRFMWIITRPGRARFASGRRDLGTADENRETVQGSLAYCGTYAVSGDILILKIEAGTYPNEEEAEQKRTFVLNGDELSWKNPTVSTGASGVARLRRVR